MARIDNIFLNLYTVTGNTEPMRLGRLFPTGWTRLQRDDEVVEIAASTKHPYTRRGSVVSPSGVATLREVYSRQVA